MIEFLSSRSRVEDHIRCNRARWELHERDETGYELIKRALPLAAGTSVHIGLADLLRGKDVESAVLGATRDYEAQVEGRGLEIDTLESQSFVFGEQRALVEGLIRLAALRVVPRLLEIYETLEVERLDVETLYEQPEVTLTSEIAGWADMDHGYSVVAAKPAWRILWRSIPDALMKHRESGDLYLLSWKTCSELPREDDSRIDMQGRSEAWAVEQRLSRIWQESRTLGTAPVMPSWMDLEDAGRSTPPRIRGIQMVYLVKGQRRDAGQPGRELQGIPSEVEGKAYKTGSPLIYGYMDSTAAGSPKLAFNSEWPCPGTPHGGMRPSKYYPGGVCPGDKKFHKRGDEWKSFPVWPSIGVKEWIRALDAGEITPEAGDILDAQWAMPVPNFRTIESIEDWRQQTIGSEKRIAEDLLTLRQLTDTRNQLNFSSLGVQNTDACNHWFGRRCPAWDLCWGPAHVGRDPVGSGLYQIKIQFKGREEMMEETNAS